MEKKIFLQTIIPLILKNKYLIHIKNYIYHLLIGKIYIWESVYKINETWDIIECSNWIQLFSLSAIKRELATLWKTLLQENELHEYLKNSSHSHSYSWYIDNRNHLSSWTRSYYRFHSDDQECLNINTSGVISYSWWESSNSELFTEALYK